MKKLAFILLLCFSFIGNAQPAKKSPVYKEPYRFQGLPYILYSGFDAQLIGIFTLMRDANAGKPMAQHDLALRYLLGKGIPADTPKAIYWLMRSAEHDLPLAHYNLGILHLNGIGVPWNPFEAFKHFRKAAEAEIPEALFVMGIFYSENFVVPRNWAKTFSYIKQSAELGCEDANEALKELRARGIDSIEHPNSTNSVPSKSNASNSSGSLIFIDFQSPDTTTVPPDSIIQLEAIRETTISQKIKSTSQSTQSTQSTDTTYSAVLRAAEHGVPEALCYVGRMYETGTGVKKDVITAALYYFWAIRGESVRAPALLWHLIQTDDFAHEFEKQTKEQLPSALTLWAGLTALQLSSLLNEQQAFTILTQAADEGYAPAMAELGYWCASGRSIKPNKDLAAYWFKKAAEQGNIDAKIRLSLMTLRGDVAAFQPDSAFSFLKSAADNGSLLALNSIAYCYEKGLYVAQNKGEAYHLYHRALSRGSATAYQSLQRMYDELRPDEPEFQIP